MKTTKIFMMAALALTFAACSNDDNDIQTPGQPAKAKGIPFTATISIDNSAATRAITENGTTLETSWAAGDKVALIHNGVNDEMEVESVSGGVATITGTITGSPSGGDAVTIIYPSDAADGTTGNVKADVLAAQNGTLTGTGGTSIAEKYDVRKGTGTLNSDGSSLSGNVSLTNQNAIFKLTLKDIEGANDVSATSVKIYNQENTLLTTIIPASGYEKVMYVALPTTATTLKFSVTDGTTNYFNMASGLSLAAKYYQSTIKLATVGHVIAANGKCYKDASAATGASTTAVAMIAYVGSGTDNATYQHGLAIALSDEGEMFWSTAKSTCEGKTAVSGAAWLLPSQDQWKAMFKANGGSESSYSGLNSALATAGGNSSELLGSYWSSTETGGSTAYFVRIFGDTANFMSDGKASDYGVRACLAF